MITKVTLYKLCIYRFHYLILVKVNLTRVVKNKKQQLVSQ